VYKNATLTGHVALDRYATDPRYQAYCAQLVALCGGPEGITVYDIETKE
jgi:hypothetical protein